MPVFRSDAAFPPPLQGLRVLDLSRLLPGPFATLRLAELGADVLKIDAPGAGDAARTMMQSAADAHAGRPGAFYQMVNRGKRETRIDLKSEGGRAVLLALARDADVLVESFRPGMLGQLGLGYETLRAANPKLVHCSITGFGSAGPFAARAGHDVNFIAYTGVLDQFAAADGTPVLPNLPIAGLLGGAYGALTQILAALWHVARGGTGRFIDVSIAHLTYEHNVPALVALANGDERATHPGYGLQNGGVPCYNLYRTQDGRWVAVGALELRYWQTLCAALDRDDWAERHWTLGQAIGGPDAVSLTRELAKVFASETLQTWIDRLELLDCCVSPVLTPAEAARHPLFNEEALNKALEDAARVQDAQLQGYGEEPGSARGGWEQRPPTRPAGPGVSSGSGTSPDTPSDDSQQRPFVYGPWG